MSEPCGFIAASVMPLGRDRHQGLFRAHEALLYASSVLMVARTTDSTREESRGITALVMELVDGEDLSQRIARGAIPIDEALPIAKQIAEALEAAHEQGIIHRDLKPANIKLLRAFNISNGQFWHWLANRR